MVKAIAPAMLKVLVAAQVKVNQERGYTLLEYCAGAAIITGILWTSLSALGGNLNTLLTAVGGWATTRAGEVVH